jgi:hypothetical protein
VAGAAGVDGIIAHATLESIGDGAIRECVHGLLDLDFGIGKAVGGNGHDVLPDMH